MRTIVTFIAFLSFLMTVSSCESKVGEVNSGGKESTRKSQTTKVEKGNKASANANTEVTQDSFQEVDSVALRAQIDSILQDSLENELPYPDDEEVFEGEYYDESELSTDQENYSESEWLDEDPEYVDYSNGDLNLKKERLLKTEIIIVIIPEILDERDSVLAVIEERMSINPDKVSQKIVVEKWYSPVNYQGYKFNRKKLMLYGVEKSTLISIYYYLGEYYFALNNMVYDLDESSKNMAFEEVEDSVLSNYLLKNENKL